MFGDHQNKKTILSCVLKRARIKPNRIIDPTHSPLYGGQWTNFRFCFMGEKTNCISFSKAESPCENHWQGPTETVCWFENGWIILTCPVSVNTNPDDIAVYWRWMSLYCLISLINLHWAVRWPKTDTVCRPSTCMRGRKGHIWAPPESVRTDSWLGGDPVETVLSSPLTWQEPSGQKSLFLVLFQREHIRENTIKAPPPSPQTTWL